MGRMTAPFMPAKVWSGNSVSLQPPLFVPDRHLVP